MSFTDILSYDDCKCWHCNEIYMSIHTGAVHWSDNGFGESVSRRAGGGQFMAGSSFNQHGAHQHPGRRRRRRRCCPMRFNFRLPYSRPKFFKPIKIVRPGRFCPEEFPFL